MPFNLTVNILQTDSLKRQFIISQDLVIYNNGKSAHRPYVGQTQMKDNIFNTLGYPPFWGYMFAANSKDSFFVYPLTDDYRVAPKFDNLTMFKLKGNNV